VLAVTSGGDIALQMLESTSGLIVDSGRSIDHGFASAGRYSTVCSGALVTVGFQGGRAR